MSNNEATEILLNDKDDHGFDVGERLKALRKSKGLSQRKLARRSGVSNGTISLIEQNKISPSVASLKHLLSGMHVSISEFFSVRWMPKQNFFFRANELSEISSDTGISFRQVGDDLSHKRMQIMRERYADGADTGETMLQHEGEEGGIVLCGRIEITVSGQVQVLSAGDAYYFKSSLPHRFRNVGEQECEIVSVCTPPTF